MKIRKNDLTVSFLTKNRKYEINYKGFSWVNEGRPPYIIIRHKIGRNYAHTIRTFGCALEKQFSCVDNRITARYSGFLGIREKITVYTRLYGGNHRSEYSGIFDQGGKRK